MTPRSKVETANPHPCSACPWRLENHGVRHPDGWYTKANRARLWARLRRGESMTCHPTDQRNPLPPGFDPVPDGVTTHECTGALVLQQRELHRFNLIAEAGGDLRSYLRRYARGMTRNGLAEVVARYMRMPYTAAMPHGLDLNAPVGVDGLPWPPEAS